MVEGLLAASSPSVRITERPDMARVAPLREARMCYDHLAGRLGVAIAESFLKNEWAFLNGRDFSVSEKGRLYLTRCLNLDWEKVECSRRLFGRRCIDWSERKPHIGGVFGAALARSFLERDWLRRSKESRCIYPTQEGRKRFYDFFKVHC